MSYVHLDLKPENIMFSKKTSDQLKLIDFGLATKIDPNREVKVTTGNLPFPSPISLRYYYLKGTPEFAAPEVIGAKEIGFYTDMWSVGVLAYILLSGLSPFGGENDEETLENVRKCDWSMDGEPEFEQISEDAKARKKMAIMNKHKSKSLGFHSTIIGGRSKATNDCAPSIGTSMVGRFEEKR
jgi:serine/threonine protein kinase